MPGDGEVISQPRSRWPGATAERRAGRLNRTLTQQPLALQLAASGDHRVGGLDLLARQAGNQERAGIPRERTRHGDSLLGSIGPEAAPVENISNQ